jgi:hypothetical protein
MPCEKGKESKKLWVEGSRFFTDKGVFNSTEKTHTKPQNL